MPPAINPSNFNSQIVEVLADSNYDSGDIFRIGKVCGIVLDDVVAGEFVKIAMAGEFDLPKDGNAANVGDEVYRINKDQASAAAGSIAIGVCIKKAAASDTTIKVWFVGYVA